MTTLVSPVITKTSYIHFFDGTLYEFHVNCACRQARITKWTKSRGRKGSQCTSVSLSSAKAIYAKLKKQAQLVGYFPISS